MRPSKRWGQHFLAPAWAERVLEVLSPCADDVFVEIGPGTGALTFPLAQRVARVVAVEVDRHLAARLARTAPAKVDVVTADFLKTRVAALAARCGTTLPVRIAGNLPYNVSTPILFRLLEEADGGRVVRDATVMLQREVAERLTARPGTPACGVLSILTLVSADVAPLLEVPPGAFRPVPQVRSTVVRLTFRAAAADTTVVQWLTRLVRSVFTQRRKMLANALRPFADSAGVPAGAALRAAGLDGRRRPEALQLPEWVRLAEFFASASAPPVL